MTARIESLRCSFFSFLPEKGKVREPARDLFSRARNDADRHELIGVRRIDLDDGHVLDAHAIEPGLNSAERGLVGDGEDDGVSAVRERARRAFARGVDALSGYLAKRKISSNDDVVEEGCRSRRDARRLTVNAMRRS